MDVLLDLGLGDSNGIPTRGIPDIKIQRASGRKTSGRGDLYSGSFSKIHIVACPIYTSILRLGIERVQLLSFPKSSSAAIAISIMSSNTQAGVGLCSILSLVDPGLIVSPLAIHALVMPISLHGT